MKTLFSCNLCAQTYNTKQPLVLHLKEHIGIRGGLLKPNKIIIFKCDLCAQQCNIKHILELHLNEHIQTKFSLSGHLKSHKLTQSKKKTFQV